MNRHDKLDVEARERAALHALGALGADEAREYDAHLAACDVCRDESISAHAAVADLALLAPAAAPPPGLKARLLDRARSSPRAAQIADETGTQALATRAGAPAPPPAQAAAARPWQVWSNDGAGGAFLLDRAGSAAWEKTGFEGVSARRLMVDKDNDRVTMLVRMTPGSSYPAHRHGGPEECYVIEGDLRTGEVLMNSGDFKFSKEGSLDAIQSTENGCLLLIVSSLHDELIRDARR